ncbi:MAG: gliding motility-associated ABC transporter ATP-binding subunit GldA [Saprospiraceae bacterium]|nr:gliding motility-associated ABC transporter ATP-binding subunit GldA [Saprospiraceae bacterium]
MSIAVSDLTKNYGSQLALDRVSFQIQGGEIVGLLGPNGAGKTTTMKILSGYLEAFDGVAQVGGLNVSEEPLAVKQMIGYLPEHNPLYLDMYVREYLAFIASIHNDTSHRSLNRLIEETGLGTECHKKIGSLSKGYRQRVGLAQALIHDPQVLILDEPTSGLDPNQLVEIRQLIKKMGIEKTVIFSSHIMQEVQALCDRVIILNRGRVVADEKIDQIDKLLHPGTIVIVEFDRDLEPEAMTLPKLTHAKRLGERRLQLSFAGNVDQRKEIFDFAVSKGIRILEMRLEKTSIEDVFQVLTN